MKKLLVTPEGTFELELTSQEIAQRETDAIKTEERKVARLAKEEAHKQTKASALAKLTALGLTEEEVNSIL